MPRVAFRFADEFESLYYDIIREAISSTVHSDDSELIMGMLFQRLKRVLDGLRDGVFPSDMHLETYSELRQFWKLSGLGCETSCFLCLARMPE